MINIDNYENLYNNRDERIVKFHETVSNHYNERQIYNLRHSLLESLGKEIYKDTGTDNKDFAILALSVGYGGQSLARERYARIK